VQCSKVPSNRYLTSEHLTVDNAEGAFSLKGRK
jgi:hypothetical protein